MEAEAWASGTLIVPIHRCKRKKEKKGLKLYIPNTAGGFVQFSQFS